MSRSFKANVRGLCRLNYGYELTLPQSLTLLTLLIIRAMIHGNVMKLNMTQRTTGMSHHSVRVPSFIARWEATGDGSGLRERIRLQDFAVENHLLQTW